MADDVIQIGLLDDGPDVYSFRSFGIYLFDGTLFGVAGQAGPMLEKTAASAMLLQAALQVVDVNVTQVTFGNINFINPQATEITQGVVELADAAEAVAGVDSTRAITPLRAKASADRWLGLTAAGAAALNIKATGSVFIRCSAQGDGNTVYSTSYDQGQTYDWIWSTTADRWLNLKLGLRVAGSIAWHAGNDGAGSGLDADLLQGQPPGYYTNIAARLGYNPVNKAGDAISGLLTVGMVGADAIAARPQAPSGVEVVSSGIGAGAGPALITFHRTGNFAAFFGMDIDNQLRFGGYSISNAAFLIWHSGNDGAGSGLDADLLDGRHASDFVLKGDPTQFGSNANGNWSIDGNGFIEQWGWVDAAPPVFDPISEQWVGGGAMVISQGHYTHQFPIPFSDLSTVRFSVQLINGDGSGNANRDIFPQLRSRSLTHFTFFAQDTDAGAIAHGYSWEARGK